MSLRDAAGTHARPGSPVPPGGVSFIGKPTPLAEDRRFVRGRGRYINDIELVGMLHLAVVPAPVAHARLIGIDTSAARKVPGVVAVITGADLTAMMDPIPQELDIPRVIWYPLVVDKIRYAGEWVAAIAATSRAIAEDAADTVLVEYEELAPVVDPEFALSPEAPLLHEPHGSNVVWQNELEWGDVTAAFESASCVVEQSYRWNRHSGVPLETFGCIVSPEPSGVVDIWASHQNPNIQQEMVNVLRLDTVRVHMDVDVGGSFGSKRGRKQMYLTAFAALVTGCPVKFIEDRLENMQAGDGHGPDRVYRVRLAATEDGIIEALDVQIIEDLGAYCGRGARQITKPTTAFVGPYKIRNIRYSGYGVLTCKTNQVPFRGAGQSPHNFILERTVDQLARALSIDPVEIRRRNYIAKSEFPYEIPTGAIYDSGDYAGALELAVGSAGLDDLRRFRAAARAEGRLVGIGVAGAIEPSGGAEPEGTRIQVDEKGRVVVTLGFQSCGQGHESMVAQIVSAELGVAFEDVSVQRANGTGGIVGGATTGSRMTLMLGGAVRTVSGRVRERLRQIAAAMLEANPADIVVDGTFYHLAGDPAAGKELRELAEAAYRARFLLPQGFEPGIVEHGVFPGPPNKGLNRPRIGSAFPSYGFEFHVVLLEVDPDTFEMKFLRYVVVHDCGTVINPLAVEGFVYGGIGHGVAGALYEHFIYDEQGWLKSASFMDYLLPTATEVPRVELYGMETPSPIHPYGAKGTAEGAYMTTPAAIASAVEDAMSPFGLVIDEIPITPMKLFTRVNAAGSPALPGALSQGEAK